MSTQPRRLSVGTLRPRDVVLEIDGVEYEIRGDIPIEGMISLLQIHKRLEAIGSGDEVADAVEALDAVTQANDVIVAMIREKYPDAVVPRLGVTEVTGVLAFIVGNDDGPIGAVEQALVEGVPPPSEEEIQRRIEEAVARATAAANGEEVDDPPTTMSRSDSSTFSSPSESTSDGHPSGGSESPGDPSAPTASG